MPLYIVDQPDTVLPWYVVFYRIIQDKCRAKQTRLSTDAVGLECLKRSSFNAHRTPHGSRRARLECGEIGVHWWGRDQGPLPAGRTN